MNQTESKLYVNISATPADFTLRGCSLGYVLAAHAGAWNGGSVSVSMQAPDGTFVPTGMTLSGDGVYINGLPPGRYRLVIASATGVSASLTSTP